MSQNKITYPVILICMLISIPSCIGAEIEADDRDSISITAMTREEKLWGLMQVWAEAKFNFVYFHKIPDLNWDALVQETIPKVISAQNQTDYYLILRELVAELDDGHTMILSPEFISGANDNPPVELHMVEDKFMVTRIGDTKEIRDSGIRPGWEVVAVGDGIPVRDYFNEHVARYFGGGTEQWTTVMGLYFMLNGPKDSKVALYFKDAEEIVHKVELTRDSRNSDGTPFVHWLYGQRSSVEYRLIDNGVAYFKIPSFGAPKIVDEFNEAFEAIDLDHIRGMILDIRINNGGDSQYAYAIASRLIDREVETSSWKTRKYLPARRSWGEDEGWYEAEPGTISPCDGASYNGPLIIIVGPNTVSAAEDFIVPLDHSQRALLIGQRTAGTTGNPLTVPLPGGGIFLVCSKWDSYPDGKEFVGSGIEPDIPIEPKQIDFLEDQDRTLEEALKVISDWDSYSGLLSY